MKRVKNVFKKNPRINWLPFLILLFVSALSTSCNNADKKGDPVNKDTTTNIITDEKKALDSSAQINKDAIYEDDDTAAAYDPQFADATWYMKLPASTLKKLMKYGMSDDNDIKQLRFKFVKSGKYWGLEVKGKRKGGWSETKDTLETLKDRAPVENVNKLERRNQRIYRGELKKVLGQRDYTDHPIPGGKFVDIYIRASQEEHPEYPGQKIIFLIYSRDLTSLLKSKFDDETGGSNPSPPKGNCNTDCDEEPEPPLFPPKKKN